ncbi:uncharacterized protein BO97DRAFT_449071 [Aspergillus homomorphus CBS 101889]|uniref:Uncharacterized protein n=1 Tax=Aspergillus homomorphus (strain CBS 101889) TaxID=1450537 RepID=A0A395I102_ASPHC|nr:hypothetical protein BO97DRAFT_449071 [Aspergillus homomorphus CBS 101889]RAL13740.1 hypothetical protein BO97DRAFT_449071 [Aspergillus homomorphus CBS 101889]
MDKSDEPDDETDGKFNDPEDEDQGYPLGFAGIHICAMKYTWGIVLGSELSELAAREIVFTRGQSPSLLVYKVYKDPEIETLYEPLPEKRSYSTKRRKYDPPSKRPWNEEQEPPMHAIQVNTLDSRGEAPG